MITGLNVGGNRVVQCNVYATQPFPELLWEDLFFLIVE